MAKKKPETRIGYVRLASPDGYAAATEAGRLYTYGHRAATVDYPPRMFKDATRASEYAREIARKLKKRYIGELEP